MTSTDHIDSRQGAEQHSEGGFRGSLGIEDHRIAATAVDRGGELQVFPDLGIVGNRHHLGLDGPFGIRPQKHVQSGRTTPINNRCSLIETLADNDPAQASSLKGCILI